MTSDNGFVPPSGYVPPHTRPYPSVPGPGAPAPYPAAAGHGGPYAYPVAPFRAVPLPPLATWAQRAGGFLVDQAVPTTLSIVGLAVWLPEYVRFIQELVSITASTTAAANGQVPIFPNPFGPGYLVLMVLSLVGSGFSLWNRTFRQGRTGQSIGKQLVGIRLVNEATMAPLGAGMSFVRDLVHSLDGAVMYVGYLWPLWDPKRQTFADKICHTVVVVAEVERVPLPVDGPAPGARRVG